MSQSVQIPAEPADPVAPKTAAALTLKEKLAEVAYDCGYVLKDGVNQFHKYNYATAATIFERVGESLYKHRLTSLPHFKIVESVSRTNTKGGTETFVTVECTLTLADLDSPEVNVWNGFGSGMDNGDKAVMKAQTAALKYAWMMGLNISTGDDPEADAKVDARAEGKPLPKPEPRGPYKPSDTPPIAPLAPPEEPTDDPGYDPDPERPSIFDAGKAPVMTKAELAAAAGHAVIANGGSALQGVQAISTKLIEVLKPGTETCSCGSPLTRKTTSKTKQPYLTCELSDKAFRKNKWAMDQIANLAMAGVCGENDHTWRWD
jgi:ERF superfamily protein